MHALIDDDDEPGLLAAAAPPATGRPIHACTYNTPIDACVYYTHTYADALGRPAYVIDLSDPKNIYIIQLSIYSYISARLSSSI
jgi:hypothetical protein